MSFGNFLGNIMTNTVLNADANNKTDFISKYSTLSDKYNKLTPLGGQKQVWHYFLLALLLIGTISCFVYSKEKIDTVTGEKIPQTDMQKLLYKLAWVILLMFLISLGYSGYNYFGLYLPQYNEWYSILPTEGKSQLRIINALERVVANRYNNRRLN
jgi:hypothetical protein